MTTSPGRKAQYAFISSSGWGNLGDAAIIDSLISGIRRRVPGAEIIGFTLNPSDSLTRHKVPALPISSFSMPFYPVQQTTLQQVEQPSVASTDEREEPPADPVRGSSALASARAALRRSSLSALALAAARLRHEPRAMSEMREILRGTAAVVVAGGGQLDALFGGFFGQPYVLWRWGRLARGIGARYLVLSVGTGTLSFASRIMVCRALRLADYRSFRDRGSRELLGAPRLTHADPIVPDLAFGLQFDPLPMPSHSRITVGVSPMNYQHPDFYPRGTRDRYARHIAVMTEITKRLLAEGYEVVLFTTDSSDDVAVKDLIQSLHLPVSATRERLSVARTDSVSALMDVYSRLDLVIAARLHGAVLAHVAHRPVFAVAHERKVITHMSTMGQERYCVDIEGREVESYWQRILDLVAERSVVSCQVADQVALLRGMVDAQYDLLFSAGRH